jgi:hypothetical protein
VNEPTPRQVLYALVGAGFHLVVAVLIVGAEMAGLVPRWWTVAMTVVWVAVAVVAGIRWKRTVVVLGLTMGGFVVWTVGTLVLR